MNSSKQAASYDFAAEHHTYLFTIKYYYIHLIHSIITIHPSIGSHH
jgi:hypothetical protein